jgi:predicted HicB family RNase H-like nuclease
MSNMGKKRLRGVPILHDEVKKTRAIRLTNTAYEAIQEAATSEGISLSEFVERWGRTLKPPTHSSHG